MNMRENLAISVCNFSDFLRMNKSPAEARDGYGRALAILEPMVKDNPKNPDYPLSFAYGLRGRGLAHFDLGDAAGAAADTRRSLGIWDGMTQRGGWHWLQIACCHATLSALAGRPGRRSRFPKRRPKLIRRWPRCTRRS